VVDFFEYQAFLWANIHLFHMNLMNSKHITWISLNSKHITWISLNSKHITWILQTKQLVNIR
ncbi:MAG: hypothetical protein ACKPKO_40895, partial [Candidatus Fonsibacter sp.]